MISNQWSDILKARRTSGNRFSNLWPPACPEQECRDCRSLPQWYDALRHILLGIIWRIAGGKFAALLHRTACIQRMQLTGLGVPTSVLQRKMSSCIYSCPACALYEDVRSWKFSFEQLLVAIRKNQKLIYLQCRQFQRKLWNWRLFLYAESVVRLKFSGTQF